MRIRKTFISVFLTAFFIGCIFVPTSKKEIIAPVAATTAIPEKMPSPPLTPESEKESFVEPADWQDKSKFKVELLETGEFHSDEVTAKTGETWLGLFKFGDSFSLQPTKIKVRKIPNPDLFDKEVEVNQKGASIFLLKGSRLKPSEVKTIFNGEQSISEKKSMTFNFEGENYKLWTEGEDTEGYLTKGSKLMLSRNGKTQNLRFLDKGCSDCSWDLYWVGDVDNDGKLDFYLNLSEHYNVILRVLFLSSEAKGDKLVEAAAVFGTVGC